MPGAYASEHQDEDVYTRQRIALFSQLSAAQWNEELGEALGGNAGDYAPVIAALPVETPIDARRSFVRAWGERDPEAAAQWLESLPEYAASQPAAAGLAAAWIRYDADAATAWAAGLPAGPARDGAAKSISYWFSMGHSEDAWHWAATISDPQMRERAESSGDPAAVEKFISSHGESWAKRDLVLRMIRSAEALTQTLSRKSHMNSV